MKPGRTWFPDKRQRRAERSPLSLRGKYCAHALAASCRHRSALFNRQVYWQSLCSYPFPAPIVMRHRPLVRFAALAAGVLSLAAVTAAGASAQGTTPTPLDTTPVPARARPAAPEAGTRPAPAGQHVAYQFASGLHWGPAAGWSTALGVQRRTLPDGLSRTFAVIEPGTIAHRVSVGTGSLFSLGDELWLLGMTYRATALWVRTPTTVAPAGHYLGAEIQPIFFGWSPRVAAFTGHNGTGRRTGFLTADIGLGF